MADAAPDPQSKTPLDLLDVAEKLRQTHLGQSVESVVNPVGFWGSRIPGMVESGIEALRLPGDVYQGKVDPVSPEGIRRSMDLAMTLGLGGRAAAEPSAAGIFGGDLARTANRPALARAMKHELGGAHSTETFYRTGWFRGTDGKWRFEIDDSDAALRLNSLRAMRDQAQVEGSGSSRLGFLLEHTPLYAAYPDLWNMPVRITNDLGGAHGVWDPNTNVISLSSHLSDDEMRSTLLHEIQHGVQMRERFAQGGNPNMFRPETVLPQEQAQRYASLQKDFVAINDLLDKYVGERQKLDPNYSRERFLDDFPDFREKIQKLSDEYLDLHYVVQTAQHEAYRRLAGETEARTVQKRRDMSGGERRASFPPNSADVPVEQQTVQPPVQPPGHVSFDDLVPQKPADLSFDDLVPRT